MSLAVALLGCSDPSLSAHEAHRLADPHLEAFFAFERWVQRAEAADPAFASANALEETLFAPLRLERSVCGAWAELRGRALALGDLRPPADGLPWVRIQPGSGRPVEIAVHHDRAGERTCIAIRRAPGGTGQLMVAFALTEGT